MEKTYKNVNEPCCGNPDIVDAALGWTWCRGRFCRNCDMFWFNNKFIEWIFANFISWLWGGRLYIYETERW